MFARSAKEREFALELGAAWTGDTAARPPEPLHAIIDTTPAWRPVLSALENLRPGGRLVINAIRKEAGDQELMAGINYERQLWLEKEIKSVANVTRADLEEFLPLAAKIPLKPEVQVYPMEAANQAQQYLGLGAQVVAQYSMEHERQIARAVDKGERPPVTTIAAPQEDNVTLF